MKICDEHESHYVFDLLFNNDTLGKFRVKTELEQQIWSECTRLISNSIIFYNAFILSRLLNQREKTKRYEEADLLKKASPIAWRHINLYGLYEFYRKNTSIDIDEIINMLEKAPIWN